MVIKYSCNQYTGFLLISREVHLEIYITQYIDFQYIITAAYIFLNILNQVYIGLYYYV